MKLSLISLFHFLMKNAVLNWGKATDLKKKLYLTKFLKCRYITIEMIQTVHYLMMNIMI